MDDIKVIVYNESTKQSIVSDIFTFGCLVFVLFCNYMWLGNKDAIVYSIFCMFFLKCVAANSKTKKMSGVECYKYLKGKFEDK